MYEELLKEHEELDYDREEYEYDDGFEIEYGYDYY